MLAWLWDKIVGKFCSHVWETVNEGPLLHSDGKNISGHYYEKQCKKCGSMKDWKFRA